MSGPRGRGDCRCTHAAAWIVDSQHSAKPSLKLNPQSSWPAAAHRNRTTSIMQQRSCDQQPRLTLG